MKIIPAAATAWRDERTIEQAVRDHDKAGLAKGIALALAFIATLLGGTKYAPLVAVFADPAYVGAAGVLIAGAVAALSHWATNGALANQQSAAVAGSAGNSPSNGPSPSPGTDGSGAANSATASEVRPVNSPSPGDYVQGA